MLQLDLKVAALKSFALATSTKRTYATYLHAYLNFCSQFGLPALPATDRNITRYIAHLHATKSPQSIQQYLSVIRLLHLEFQLPNPLHDSHGIATLTKAIKRHKGTEPTYKLTLSPQDLLAIKQRLSLSRTSDAQIWSIILTCFFGLLRISNVSAPLTSSWDPEKVVKRTDITFKDTGCVITIKWSKTIQFRERVFQAALPRLNSELCPTSALINFLHVAGPIPPHFPAWSYITTCGTPMVPTPASLRPRLQSLFVSIGLPPAHYNTHSLRRSGASHLVASGVPLEVIKLLGDWKSDSVFRYLKPTPCQQLTLVNNSFS